MMFRQSTKMSKEPELQDVLVDPGDATVDIVFVHGLGGDKERTWTWTPDRSVDAPEHVFWPKDLLPKSFPQARIVSFGYDASFAHFYPLYGPKDIPQGTTLDDHSTALFQRLISLRRDPTSAERPIIFVAHSLGGLVTANALSRPNGTDRKRDEIANRTVGVIFLGTPFEGSEQARWGATALRFLSLVSSTNDEKVKDLEKRSAKLMSINDSFYKYVKTRDRSSKNFLEVACFFEEYPMKIGGKKFHIVPKESACLKGIDPQSIPAHHTDMCKFEDEYRNGFKCITDQLNRWIDALKTRSVEGAASSEGGAFRLGDVVYHKEFQNHGGVVTGHMVGTAENANHVTGSSSVVGASKCEVGTC